PRAELSLRVSGTCETDRHGAHLLARRFTRRGSVRRVATAVGAGAADVAAVHAHLTPRIRMLRGGSR
ncbi:MAG: hypothetical protein WCF12_13520, partial [Propionicimonas sp.]